MTEKKYDIVRTVSGEYRTTLNRTYRARKPWQPLDPNQVRSFMPGTVEKIDVKVGQSVKEGQRLLVFRAMKMNNNILSPATGKVKAINVTEGENIAKNHIMVEIG
ncbi:MAG: acetyl-CoA carboxylase biotin carboxyl carrier protein subunit [Rikenellaceae bacterium]|nr:acetyl-CoA carboxylase biotin carboxyl carrier protein subunit [Rikenellaceae bacterium]